MFAIGRFLQPFGVRGMIKFRPYSGETSHLPAVSTFYLGRDSRHFCQLNNNTAGFQPQTIERWDTNGASVVCKIIGIENPEDARAFSGNDMYVPRKYAAPCVDDEYYIEDLRGMRIMCNGVCVGIVRGVYTDAYAPLFEIERALPDGYSRDISILKKSSAKKHTNKSRMVIIPFISQFFSPPKKIRMNATATRTFHNTAQPVYEITLLNDLLLE